MINYGKTRCTVRPEPVVADEYSVWVHSNIVDIHEDDFDGYEFDMLQYSKDEYFNHNVNSTEERLEAIEEAIMELAEMLGGDSNG